MKLTGLYPFTRETPMWKLMPSPEVVYKSVVHGLCDDCGNERRLVLDLDVDEDVIRALCGGCRNA